MTASQENTGLRDHYARQLAADLQKNLETQEQVRAQLAGLQQDLATLGQDQQWLEDMHRQISGTGASGKTAAPDPENQARTGVAGTPTTARQRVGRKPAVGQPDPRSESDAVASLAGESGPGVPAGNRNAKKTAAGSTKTGTPQQKRTEKAAPATRRKKGEPSLSELLAPLLSSEEPRSVNEVMHLLQDKHPERTTTKQLVRNALNTLVSKGTAALARQQNSVFYLAAKDGVTTGGNTGGSSPTGEIPAQVTAPQVEAAKPEEAAPSR